MEGACSLYGTDKNCIQGLGEDTWREDNFADTDTDGRIMY